MEKGTSVTIRDEKTGHVLGEVRRTLGGFYRGSSCWSGLSVGPFNDYGSALLYVENSARASKQMCRGRG